MIYIWYLRFKVWLIKNVLGVRSVTVEERLLFDLDSGWAERDDLREIFRQRRVFRRRRREIERMHLGKVVGVCNNEVIAGDTIHAVFDEADRRFPDKLVYFEPVGTDIL